MFAAEKNCYNQIDLAVFVMAAQERTPGLRCTEAMIVIGFLEVKGLREFLTSSKGITRRLAR